MSETSGRRYKVTFAPLPGNPATERVSIVVVTFSQYKAQDIAWKKLAEQHGANVSQTWFHCGTVDQETNERPILRSGTEPLLATDNDVSPVISEATAD